MTEALLDLGTRWGPAQMRKLRPLMVATYGAPGEFDDLQDKLASAARLSQPLVESGDLTEYQLVMTPEQAACLEAAIGPLSRPAPNDETGERDHRPAGQRRVEALTQVCRRSSGLDADGQGAEGAAGSSAAMHVTIALADLEQRTGAGEVIGSSATGTLLSPEVLRRVACDAALVPHVLGSAGEDLDLGRVVRLFTRAQRRRLWRRDRCCTYPGCAAPASWCRAHHVRHWADGGGRHRQRRAALRTAPHRGAPPQALGAGAVRTRRAGPVRGVGPEPRQLRPAPGTPTTRTGHARPATTDPTTPAPTGRRNHQRRRRRPSPGRVRPHRARRRPVLRRG